MNNLEDNNKSFDLGDTVEGAINYIEEKMQESYQMGANDSEISDLNRLVNMLKNKEISPKEAKEGAFKIVDRKNDYH